VKRVLAVVLLSVGPAVADDAIECPSSKECLAQARAALAQKRWGAAEEYAAYALDWAEPRDAALALEGYRLAAQASLGARKPMRAQAWTSAGRNYPGPWQPGPQRRPAPSPELERLDAQAEQRAAPGRAAGLEGHYIAYVGRGMWNTLRITKAGPNRFRWKLDGLRPGNSEAVRRSGPAQMSEGNEGVAIAHGASLAIEYESASDPARRCKTAIEITATGVEVAEGAPDCRMGNPGVNVFGPYRRVERE
jgi:hypothetical protein